MSTVFSDDFNRADNADLGANWDSGYTGCTNLKILSNQVRETTLATIDNMETVNVAIANDQWAQMTLATYNIVAGVLCPRILIRWAAPPNPQGYEIAPLCNAGGVTSRLARWDAGVFTQLTSESATTWGSGDVLYGEARGTTIKLFRNGGQLLSTTDATYASGRVGINCYNNQSAGDADVDNFSAGDFLSNSSLMLLGVGK